MALWCCGAYSHTAWAHRDEPNPPYRINFTSAFRGTAETISRTTHHLFQPKNPDAVLQAMRLDVLAECDQFFLRERIEEFACGMEFDFVAPAHEAPP